MHTSIRFRLLAAFLVVTLAGAAGLSLYFLSELEDYGLRKLEERLHTEALVIGAMTSAQLETLSTSELGDAHAAALSREFARISPDVATRLRVLDTSGEATVDSGGYDAIGEEYGDRAEVLRALDGEYGAATRVTEDDRVALYVAVPIKVDDRIVGVAYASSTTFSVRTLLRAYRPRLALVALLFVLATVVITELVTRWLTTPLRDLAVGAEAFASGDHSVRVRPAGARETRAVADAFNTMASETELVLGELRDEERRRSRFVSDVSHELRTPLTAIRGAAETLLEGDVPEEDARQFLSTIVRESERLSRLATDLLTLQRIEGATGELPIAPLDVRAIAERTIESLQPLTDGRGVTVELHGEAPRVLGDRDRLQQVLGNLIDNASRMTPAGGVVTVRLAAEEKQSVVRVADQGPGIADEAMPHLFDRFYRVQASRDRSSGGAGLGLPIVAAIVRAHAGTVTAENIEGGAEFTIRLPAIGG